jgi:NAD(P)-dependent dehydrogenase (short-subunit alcohol dehydrogenase family)
MQTMSKLLKMGQIAPITPKRVYNASEIEDAFRFMQQGQHLGKIVISVRDSNSTMSLDMAAVTNAQKLKLRSDASYLLIGGLGGLGRSVARHLVEHGARRIVFLSRSAGSGAEDSDTVQELESMDCEVRLVKGSVINKDDVIHAIQQAPNLKGILQLAMVLRDQNFIRMTHGEWTGACTPKIEGSWNLHNATVEFGISLDFFVLYSSLSGTTGQPGQANYAAASTFLDSFAQYRNNLGLAASVIDIGAVQEVGYVSQDEALRQRMSYAHSITERELLEAVSAAIVFSPRNPVETSGDAKFTHKNTIAIGLNTTVPLSSPDCRAIWKKDSRMAVYHNSSKSSATKSGSGGELQSFVSSAKNDPSILKKDDTVAFLATEIGKKLFSFLLRSDEDLDISMPLSQLGMDSLVGVEMRGWWRQAFAFDISVLELLGAGNLEGLGQHAAEGLLKLLGEVSS